MDELRVAFPRTTYLEMVHQGSGTRPVYEIDDMLNVIENAGSLAKDIEAETVFNFLETSTVGKMLGRKNKESLHF